MTRARLAALGRSLGKDDEVVIEATGNAMAVVRVLSPYVGRVIVANPLQVKAIAHAHVKTDKIDAGVLASLRAADFLPEIWLPDADTERRRRLVARRNQVVRHRTRIKNEVPAILHAHLVPAACFLLADPRPSRPPDCGGRRRPQAGRAVLAPADQEYRLPMGTPSAGREQDAVNGAASRPTGQEGKQAQQRGNSTRRTGAANEERR